MTRSIKATDSFGGRGGEPIFWTQFFIDYLTLPHRSIIFIFHQTLIHQINPFHNATVYSHSHDSIPLFCGNKTYYRKRKNLKPCLFHHWLYHIKIQSLSIPPKSFSSLSLPPHFPSRHPFHLPPGTSSGKVPDFWHPPPPAFPASLQDTPG